MTPPLSPLLFPLLYVGTAGKGLATNFTYNAYYKIKECLPFLQLAPTDQAAHVCPIFFSPPGFKYIRTECPSHFIPARERGRAKKKKRGGTRFISPGSKCNQLAFFLLPHFFSLLRRGGGLEKEGKQNLFRDIWLSAAAARICSMKKNRICPKRIPVYMYCRRFYNLICWPFLCPPCINHDRYEVRITGMCGRM